MCGPVEYVQSGEGYPVLAVHGNAGGCDTGLWLGQSYIGDGFQLIAPSRFGYLRSPKPAGATPAMQADAFAGLLDILHIDQAAVLATSAGVTSTIQLALRHPGRVSALVLHSPNAPGKVDVKLPPEAAFRAMLRSDFLYWLFGSNMISMFLPKNFPLSKSMEAEVRQVMKSVLPSSARVEGAAFDTYFGNQEINAYPLEQVTTPALVVSAVDDPAALHSNARVLAERIPGGRMAAIADGGHLMLGHTKEVKNAITGFLCDTVMTA